MNNITQVTAGSPLETCIPAGETPLSYSLAFIADVLREMAIRKTVTSDRIRNIADCVDACRRMAKGEAELKSTDLTTFIFNDYSIGD